MKHPILILFIVVFMTGVKAQGSLEGNEPLPRVEENGDIRSDLAQENADVNQLEEKWFGDDAWSADSALNTTPGEKVDMKKRSREYYLVVAVLKKRSDAEGLVNSLKPRGFKAKIKESGDGLYYVHIPCYSTEQITYEQMTDVRHEFENAWYQRLE